MLDPFELLDDIFGTPPSRIEQPGQAQQEDVNRRIESGNAFEAI